MNIRIETDRLIIRPITTADTEAMFAMDSDSEVHRYLGNTPVKTIEQTAAIIEFLLQQYRDNGIARWAIELKETGSFIGWTGFKYIRNKVNGHVDFYDFGYRLARPYWGKGIATEAATAALSYGVDQLKLGDVYATTDADNATSRHILEKLGFQFVHIFNYDDPTWPAFLGKPTTWYQLKKN